MGRGCVRFKKLTGWLSTNDIGIITLPDGRHLAVAAFVSDSAANDDTWDAIIACLAKAAWDRAPSLGR